MTPIAYAVRDAMAWADLSPPMKGADQCDVGVWLAGGPLDAPEIFPAGGMKLFRNEGNPRPIPLVEWRHE